MNSTEFTTVLSKKLGMSRLEAGIRLDNLLSVITEELINGNIITIPNFGNLEVKKRKEQESTHPVTGKKMLLPPRMIVKFKPSASFNKKIKDLNYE
jgi:nucleoid DNA-binding protein